MFVYVSGTPIPLFSWVYVVIQLHLLFTVLLICCHISYICWDDFCSPYLPRQFLLSFQSSYKYLLRKSSLSFPNGINHSFLSAIKACWSVYCHFTTLFYKYRFMSVLPFWNLGRLTTQTVLYWPLMFPPPSTIHKGKHPNLKLYTYLQPPEMYLINFFGGKEFLCLDIWNFLFRHSKAYIV